MANDEGNRDRQNLRDYKLEEARWEVRYESCSARWRAGDKALAELRQPVITHDLHRRGGAAPGPGARVPVNISLEFCSEWSVTFD